MDNSFYARIVFTTAEQISYSQSKICYLEGVDCVAGQLVPKPNMGYKITVMANVNTSIDYKYYGTVSVDKGEGYAETYKFVGGEKVVKTAKTYLNRTELRYGDNSYAIKSEPTSFPNDMAGNIDKWYDSTAKKANIDCSSLSIFAYADITYDKSPYANHNLKKLVKNSKTSWAFMLPRNAAQQAEYCVKKGWVLHDIDIINYSNLQAGDMVFYDRDNGENGRYMNCSHVAIVVGPTDDGGSVNIIESTTVTNGVRIIEITANKSDKILFVARPKKL